jgi:phosphoribosylaminoimidazole-succinocarboxamide synthase
MERCVDLEALRPYASHIVNQVDILGLPGLYRGKVRDNYALAGNRRILITTDRLSAFDRMIACIPFKGQVLTQTARWWFERTAGLCPNHVLDYPDPNVVIGRQLRIIPVEIIVRAYLAGTTGTSLLTMYKAGQRTMYGVTLPDGLQDNERLPEPIITPTSKAAIGGHDEALTPAEIVRQGLMSEALMRQVFDYALALFARGQELAAGRGLILADTKYEFGIDESGRVVLADEIHTPDSSRFWRADSYAARFAAGEKPESFDKDFVRNWVVARCDPYKDDLPPIPEELILQTSQVYISAYELITSERFVLPAVGEEPVARIVGSLQGY